jgi:hypothetical protein
LSIFYKEIDYKKVQNINALLLKDVKPEKGRVCIKASGSFSNNESMSYRIKNDHEFIQESIEKFLK